MQISLHHLGPRTEGLAPFLDCLVSLGAAVFSILLGLFGANLVQLCRTSLLAGILQLLGGLLHLGLRSGKGLLQIRFFFFQEGQTLVHPRQLGSLAAINLQLAGGTVGRNKGF